MLWCVISGLNGEGSPFPNYNTLGIVINCVVCGSVYTFGEGNVMQKDRLISLRPGRNSH